MRFETYFNLGQEVLIRRFATARDSSRVESVRSNLVARDGAQFELRLQAVTPETSFNPGDFLELHSDRFDLGVRLTAQCVASSDGQLTLVANDDLELYYRRQYWRATLSVWHGLVREAGCQQPLYELWEKAQVLRDDSDLDPSIHTEIVRSPVNLSAGGVRLSLQEPVAVQERCLLFLCLDDGKPTICALCEVVWIQPGEEQGTALCGLRFSNLLDNDLTRIDRYVTRNCTFDPVGPGAEIEKSHTV